TDFAHVASSCPWNGNRQGILGGPARPDTSSGRPSCWFGARPLPRLPLRAPFGILPVVSRSPTPTGMTDGSDSRPRGPAGGMDLEFGGPGRRGNDPVGG